MKYLKSFLTFLAACSLQASLYAQTPFFTHTVEAGETLYSISKIYHITIEDIYALNPEVKSGLRSGSTIKIPQNKSGQQYTRFHTIAKGETLYQLTQLYHVSAEEICLANPGLNASNFKVGEVVVIPPAQDGAAKEAPKQQAVPQQQQQVKIKCREMHKVKRRETLFSIAREYGISTNELVAANPEMNDPDFKLKKGSFVCIPYPKQTVPTPVKPVSTPTNSELFPKKQESKRMQEISLAVLLPMKQNNSESKKMIEFYQGLLLAVEDLKNRGISANVYAYDCGYSTADMQKVLTKEALSKVDVIFGPLAAAQIPVLSNFCKQNQVKMVVPFSSQTDEVYKNPYIYVANVPKKNLYQEAYKLVIDQFRSHQFVFWKTGENIADDQDFIKGLKSNLEANRIVCKSGSVQTTADNLKSLLSTSKVNMIVPDASSLQSLNRMLIELKSFQLQYPEYKICLLGYPEWQIYSSTQLDNYFKFNTYIFSSFYKNLNKTSCVAFSKRFETAFHAPLQNTYPSFGMLGYDLGSYFLTGLSNHGAAFNDNLTSISYSILQHDFWFNRPSNWSGFINNKAALIHYTPNNTIDIIEFRK